MKKEKSKPRYRGFSLSVSLIEEINERIKNDPEYRSTADFVRDAVREKLDGMVISNELTDFEKIIYRDLMRQKRLEALKEAMNFRKQKEHLRERIKHEKKSNFDSPHKKVLKRVEEKEKETLNDIKIKNNAG